MHRYPLWGFICICFIALSLGEEAKRHGEERDGVEIQFDLAGGNALVTYNDERKTTAKIAYAEKEKIVAYRDEEGRHCLLEKVTKRKNGDGGLPLSRLYHFQQTLDKVEAEKLAGKKLVSFCGKYPITLLKEHSQEGGQRPKRSRRETELIRGVESQLSHREISKKLLVDLAIAEGLVANGVFGGKGVKRNVDVGTEHGSGYRQKVGQPGGVDYHARIRNNLPSGTHPMHPIDITSSVTIATGASHPVWSYPPSAGSRYNATGSGHFGNTSQPHSPEMHHGVPPSSFRAPGYYPPSSASKPQQNAPNYPPSSVSKPQPHYSPSSFGKPLYYPPSSTSKNQHVPAHFSPSIPPQSAYYPPSSTSKTHHNMTRPSVGAEYSPSASHGYHSSYILPSSSSKTHHNGTVPSVGAEYSPSASHGYHSSYIPPSATSKTHYTPSQNASHPSFHPGREMYAPQFPPSSTSKVYHQQYGGVGRVGSPQYPPSSTSKIHHEGPRDQVHMQFPPSSTSKIGQQGSHYAPQYPPSSTSKLHYSPAGRTPVPERPSARGTEQELGSYPPSSTSKLHYSPHTHVMPAGGIQYYPPSSTSKARYSPSSSGHDHSAARPHPHSQYPPSSTAKVYDTHPPAQIPQPPTERNQLSGFPPSSTSKLQPQHYPPSATSKVPQGAVSQHPYPPSSASKVHVTSHQNFSTPQQPGYYPPSSASKLHHAPHSPIHHQDARSGGRVTATGRVSVTPGFAYYPPSMSSKPQFAQGHHTPPDQYPYYGPSSSSHHHNMSVPTSSGHWLYSLPQYPPSSTGKIHSSQQHNGSIGHTVHSKPFYPMEQPPASPGHHYAEHRNESSPGQLSHQGAFYPPSGHHQPYQPQYPPSSSSHHQQPVGDNQNQYHHGQPPSGQQPSIRPCQSSPRSLYSITTRTILTPNGVIHRPVSVKNSGEYPCGQLPGTVSYPRYAPCSGTLTRNGQTVRHQSSCTANGNLRKSMRNSVPGLAVMPDGHPPDQHQAGYGPVSAVTQTELVHGQDHHISHHGSPFSKLQAATPENSTSNGVKHDTTAPENFEETVRNGKDVEVFEAEDRNARKPVKYRENDEENKESNKGESEEEVKEGDVLEPGDRILGKDGYTISEGFRGRVVSVTGQIAKTRGDAGKVTIPQEAEKATNSGHFKYSSDLGRYVKDNGEKNYSNCQGEPTFTCSEFLGSNGRAKICKPNPRRNPDGSPC